MWSLTLLGVVGAGAGRVHGADEAVVTIPRVLGIERLATLVTARLRDNSCRGQSALGSARKRRMLSPGACASSRCRSDTLEVLSVSWYVVSNDPVPPKEAVFRVVSG